MHRILRPLMTACLATALGLIGCATVDPARLAVERTKFREALVRNIDKAIVAVRDDHRRDATARKNATAELSSSVYAFEQRIEEVEKARKKGETAITDRLTARLAIPSHQSVAQHVAKRERENNETLRGEIGELRKMVTQRLADDSRRITNLEIKMPDPDRADRLLEERVDRAVKTAKKELARDSRNDVADLRRDISNRTALEEPVGAMLESWKRKEGIADLQSTNEYIIPAGIMIAMGLLGNAGLALRQRTSKETEEALRIAQQAKNDADSAINAADHVRDDFKTLMGEAPRSLKPKVKEPNKKEEKLGDEIVGRIEERNQGG